MLIRHGAQPSGKHVDLAESQVKILVNENVEQIYWRVEDIEEWKQIILTTFVSLYASF